METTNNTTTAEKVRVLTLPAQPQAVREARHRVHSLLQGWASPVNWDTAILLLSEVVTNAVVHGANPDILESAEIRVTVRQGPGELRIEVHDHGDGEPAPGHTGQDWAAESGRGLDLVELLADDWGTKHEGRGKSVYFMLSAEPVPAQSDRAANPRAARAVSCDDTRGNLHRGKVAAASAWLARRARERRRSGVGGSVPAELFRRAAHRAGEPEVSSCT